MRPIVTLQVLHPYPLCGFLGLTMMAVNKERIKDNIMFDCLYCAIVYRIIDTISPGGLIEDDGVTSWVTMIMLLSIYFLIES